MAYPYRPSPDHPGVLFLQAAGYTRGRPDGPPIWHVVHDMEAPERVDTAEATAQYFYDGADGRSVSATYCHDSNTTVQCVLLRDSAWTVGNRPGNARGINHEYAGYARQTAAQWLDPFGRAMFAKSAGVIRADSATFGIPYRWLSDAEVRAFRPGFTTHVQLGRVFGGSDHTDPGPGFPYAPYMQIMIGEESGPMAGFMFRVQGQGGGDGATDPLWVTDGMRRRLVAATKGEQTGIRSSLVKGGFVEIGTLDPGADDPDEYATKVGGPTDPGEQAGSGGSGEIDLDAVRTVVREELDKTRLLGA